MTHQRIVLTVVTATAIFLSGCTKVTVQTPTTPDCVAEKDAIDSVIGQFEKYQMETNAIGALDLFSPATTDKDQQIYNILIGKMDGEPGLYNTALTQVNETGYSIVGEPTTAGQRCIVTVEEQRKPFSNAKTENIALQSIKTSFSVSKEGNNWKIDQYYLTGTTPSKYGAWGY